MKGKNKKLNKFGFLSMIGLLGIFGIVTENRGFLGFFGYVHFIRYFTVIPDELFKDNIRNAGCNGFFAGIGVSTIFLAICLIIKKSALFQLAFLSGFIVSMFVFSITLVYYEYKEQSQSQE